MTVHIKGFVAQEPSLRFTPGGDPVLNFSVPFNHRKMRGTEWIDDGTTWRQVTVWGDEATALAEVLKKGHMVVFEGRERLEEFTRQDGTTGSKLTVTTKHVGIVPLPPRGERQQSQQSQQSQEDPWGGASNGVATSDIPF